MKSEQRCNGYPSSDPNSVVFGDPLNGIHVVYSRRREMLTMFSIHDGEVQSGMDMHLGEMLTAFGLDWKDCRTAINRFQRQELGIPLRPDQRSRKVRYRKAFDGKRRPLPR